MTHDYEQRKHIRSSFWTMLRDEKKNKKRGRRTLKRQETPIA